VRDSHTPQTLKVQMGLAALGGLLLVASLGFQLGQLAVAAGVIWGLLLLSGALLYAKILQRDPAVLWMAPLLLFVRAWALGCGLLLGSLDSVLTRRR